MQPSRSAADAGFHPFGCILRSVTAKSYCTSIFVFWRVCAFSPIVATLIYLHFTNSLHRFPFPQHLTQHLVFSSWFPPRPGEIVSKYSLGQIQNFLTLNPRFSFPCSPKQIFHHTEGAHKLSKVSSKNCAPCHRWSRVKCGSPLFRLLVWGVLGCLPKQCTLLPLFLGTTKTQWSNTFSKGTIHIGHRTWRN